MSFRVNIGQFNSQNSDSQRSKEYEAQLMNNLHSLATAAVSKLRMSSGVMMPTDEEMIVQLIRFFYAAQIHSKQMHEEMDSILLAIIQEASTKVIMFHEYSRLMEQHAAMETYQDNVAIAAQKELEAVCQTASPEIANSEENCGKEEFEDNQIFRNKRSMHNAFKPALKLHKKAKRDESESDDETDEWHNDDDKDSQDTESNEDEEERDGVLHINAPRRRSKLSHRAVTVLQEFFRRNINHPYPTDIEKRKLAIVAGLTARQVSNWLTNTRKRVWQDWLKKMGITGTPVLQATENHYIPTLSELGIQEKDLFNENDDSITSMFHATNMLALPRQSMTPTEILPRDSSIYAKEISSKEPASNNSQGSWQPPTNSLFDVAKIFMSPRQNFFNNKSNTSRPTSPSQTNFTNSSPQRSQFHF